MAYVPDWERLAEARKRVMATGLLKHRAQLDLCRAIADQKIRIRYLIGKEEIGGTPVPQGQGMAGHVIWRMDVIPRSVAPPDFDWQKSRPVKPWQVPPNPVFWELDWIELFSADVTKVLIVAEGRHLVAGGNKHRDSAGQDARAAEERSRTIKQGIAARLFAELFWPVPRVLAWIAFREEAGIESSWRAAIFYPTQAAWPLRDAHPRGTLLRALQDGSLLALRDGKELPREAWANANGRSWPIDVRFRREDVLALWPVERERLLAQSRATATFDPRARRLAVLGLIRASLSSRTCTVAEILAAAYGDPQGRDYWDAWLFEPLPIHTFADLLSVHRAAAEGAPLAPINGVTVPVLDGYCSQVFEALRAAAQSGERWFRRMEEPDIAARPPDSALSPVAAQMGEGRNFTLLPQEAVAWMHRNANARHLVPATLVPKVGRNAEVPNAKAVGKRPRIRQYLTEKYPSGVPEPAHCPRQVLRADIVKWDSNLRPLDESTLKRAIDEYNAGLGNHDR